MVAASNDESFRTQLEPHRRAITAHCYKMLGSLQDAEEVAQESLLRAWQRLAELRSSGAAKAWLYKIATNACLDLVKARRRRSLPQLHAPAANSTAPFGPPSPPDLWVEPAPDAMLAIPDAEGPPPDARISLRESISLAFVTALQVLPPKQRATLLLIDVLGWKPREAADLLETSVVSVNSLLQRARRNLETGIGGEPLASPESADDAALLQRYLTAWESGDLDALAAVLAEDARLSMPPQPEWYHGREAILRFLARVMAANPREYKLLPIRANGAPGIAVYGRPRSGDGPPRAMAITVLAFRAGFVRSVTRFALPDLFPRFGLPDAAPTVAVSPAPPAQERSPSA